MRRRRLLAVTSGTAATMLAGCGFPSGGEDEGEDGEGGDDGEGGEGGEGGEEDDIASPGKAVD